MKAAKILIAASLFAVVSSFTYAGPGAQYWTQRRAERANAALVVTASVPKAGVACCRITTVQRPIASHKVTRAIKTVECSGCAAMVAGETCPSA